MTVEVVEQPTGFFLCGRGFFKPRELCLYGQYSPRTTFLGLGYIMSLAANVSGTRQQGNLQIYDPYFLDSR